MRLDTKVKKTHCNADCVNLYNEHLSQQKDMFKRARVTGEGNIIVITFHRNVAETLQVATLQVFTSHVAFRQLVEFFFGKMIYSEKGNGKELHINLGE